MNIAAIVLASAAMCANIADTDQRAYCRATTDHQPAYCSSISDYSLRQRCYVAAGEDSSRCNTISDASQRTLCRADSHPHP